MIVLESDREIGYMRDAGKPASRTLVEIKNAVRPRVELDKITEQYIRDACAIPAFDDYGDFPSIIGVYLNEAVGFGIPSLKELMNGENININVGAEINGFHGNFTLVFPSGETHVEQQRLLDVTEQTLHDIVRKTFNSMENLIVTRKCVIMLGMALRKRCMKILRFRIMVAGRGPRLSLE